MNRKTKGFFCIASLTRVLTFFLVAWIAGSTPTTAQGPTKPVSVTITVIACADPCRNEGLEAAGESAPDFYAKVSINGSSLDDGITPRAPDDQDFVNTNFTITKNVPANLVNVPVAIQIWDQDSTGGDDLGDADPTPGDATLNFTVNLNTGLWTGDINSPNNCAIGNGEPGGGVFGADPKPAVLVCFQVGADADGDGLLDSWETNGIDFDGDGTIDLPLNLPPFNANPNHKDLFVEADWMACAAGGCAAGDVHSHAPTAGAINDVINAFASAPIGNLDGVPGITLHVFQDEAVPDRPAILFNSTGPAAADDFDDLKLGNPPGPCAGTFGSAADRASPNCANILGAKRSVFRYMIFGHSYAEATTSSGVSEIGFFPGDTFTGPFITGGNDFMVTLGPPGAFSAAGIIAAGGQRVAEASTFMHELGHTLGLQHGGGQGIPTGPQNFNCKPNYLSIMNYTLQFPNRDLTRPMDYSSAARGTALGSLNENAGLNEAAGIGGPAGRLTIFGTGFGGGLTTAPANGPIDWNGNGSNSETGVSADINFVSVITGCGANPNQNPLLGFDDWQNIVYNFRNSSFFADGAHGPSPQELTRDEVLAMNPLADLEVKKSVDKADALGGDTLTYTVPVKNLGPGKAVNVSVTDTLPDASTQTRSLPDLDSGTSNTQMFTFAVPCTTKDGTVLTNRASVTGTNERGFPDPDLSNNVADASTTIHTPVLTLSKTATATVNAGEAITYTITYENTGSGAASNVVITDVVPAGVYYSTALDQGAGPIPDTVTLNAAGTRTLIWNVGGVSAKSGPKTIVFTARPTLLALGGTSYTDNVSLSFQNANGCVFDTLKASASTTITVVPPTRDPATLGFWRNHPELWLNEILARIQATDQRYDGRDGTPANGALSAAEAAAMLLPGGNMPKVLEMQLLATYFNLATRRINAGTAIDSKAAKRGGLANVRAAALFAIDTLLLPVTSTTQDRYSDASGVLDEINNNKSEVY